jgi:hypothetical protein
MNDINNIVGSRFGRLVVLRPHGSRKHRRQWACQCDCGNLAVVSTTGLRSWGTKSCGCLRLERQKAPRKGKHGQIKTAEYRAWVSMKTRCYNPNVREYAKYGGRGIQVHPAWRNSFPQFLKDVGKKPSSEHSLDRKDNNGHYEPGNVRWATKKQQVANRRPRSEWERRVPEGSWEWRDKIRSHEKGSK